MMKRLVFNINTDSNPQSDTGSAIMGEIVQMHWNPTTVDTGADLRLTVLPVQGDTGDGWDVFNDNDCLGVNFTRVPVQSTHHSDGFDTGAAQEALIALAGDRLRVTVTPGGTACAGRLYLYIKNS